MICRVTVEEEKMQKLTEQQEKAERERLAAIKHANTIAGYHVTVYVDPNINERRRASTELGKIFLINRCQTRPGNPIAKIFRGAHLIETVTKWEPGIIERYLVTEKQG